MRNSFSGRLLREGQDGNLAPIAGGRDFITMASGPGEASEVALYYPQGVWLDDNGAIVGDRL